MTPQGAVAWTRLTTPGVTQTGTPARTPPIERWRCPSRITRTSHPRTMSARSSVSRRTVSVRWARWVGGWWKTSTDPAVAGAASRSSSQLS